MRVVDQAGPGAVSAEQVHPGEVQGDLQPLRRHPAPYCHALYNTTRTAPATLSDELGGWSRSFVSWEPNNNTPQLL